MTDERRFSPTFSPFGRFYKLVEIERLWMCYDTVIGSVLAFRRIMMEELEQLRQHIENGETADALAMIDELDEMSKKAWVKRVAAHMNILLIHLIKRDAEQRTTRSWDNSIQNALEEIEDCNKRDSDRGYYLNDDELMMKLQQTYPKAMRSAAEQVLGGQYTTTQLDARVDQDALIQHALQLIQDAKIVC